MLLSTDQIDNSNSGIPQETIRMKNGFKKRNKGSFIGRVYKKRYTSNPITSPSSSIETSSSVFTSPTTPPTPTDAFSYPEMPYTSQYLGPMKQRMIYSKQEKVRIAIEVIFERVYYDTFTSEQLTGENSIVDAICKQLNYHHYTTAKHVILNVKKALDRGLVFDSSRKSFTIEDKRKIKAKSFEEHLLTTLMEQGNSYQTTTRMFNGYLATKNLTKVGLRSIYNAIKRCRYVNASIEAIPQTNQSNLFHRQARFNWFCHIHARLGGEIVTPEIEGVSEFRNRLKSEWIDRENLANDNLTFVPEQIAFWDEIHIYQVCGDHHSKSLIFMRNEIGVYDPNGIIVEEQKKVSSIDN